AVRLDEVLVLGAPASVDGLLVQRLPQVVPLALPLVALSDGLRQASRILGLGRVGRRHLVRLHPHPEADGVLLWGPVGDTDARDVLPLGEDVAHRATNALLR